MSKYYQTLKPLASQTLQNWDALRGRSKDNAAAARTMREELNQMMSLVEKTFESANQMGDKCSENDTLVTQQLETQEAREKTYTEIRKESQVFFHTDILSSNVLTDSFEFRAAEEHPLREHMSGEELGEWFRSMEERLAAIFEPSKAFYENEWWEDEVKDLRRAMADSESMIDLEKLEEELSQTS